MVAALSPEWYLVLFVVGLVGALRGKARYASRMSDKPEDEVRRAEQTLPPAGGLDVAPHAVPLGVFIRVKPEAFVHALRDGRWRDVTTARDHDRIVETFMDALDRGADGILIGFSL
jgi:hypothetical protein